jgi:energy-coupling factor transporter ATP-binding protein EcfA2
VRDIFKTIAALRSTGVTILLVEQNARAALEVADHAYVLEMGEIALEGCGSRPGQGSAGDRHLPGGGAVQVLAMNPMGLPRSAPSRCTCHRHQRDPRRPRPVAPDPLVGYAATRASVELKKTFQKHLGPLDLRAVEFSILVLVAANPGANQRQLGQSLEVSAPNMAITLDKMVERGWVERVRSTEDRRAQEIHLTAAGRVWCSAPRRSRATWKTKRPACSPRRSACCSVELLLKLARGKSKT